MTNPNPYPGLILLDNADIITIIIGSVFSVYRLQTS